MSRDAMRMLAAVFGDDLIVSGRRMERVEIKGVTFLLNNRALEFLNHQAFENKGQFQVSSAAPHTSSKE